MIYGRKIESSAVVSLIINADNQTNESHLIIKCGASNTDILKINIDARSLVQLLGKGIGCINADMTFYSNDLVGKIERIEELTFKVPQYTDDRQLFAREKAIKIISEKYPYQFNKTVFVSNLFPESSFCMIDGVLNASAFVKIYE